jgi:hypothetical protein
MSHELLYTSAPQGLKPGSQGFCTVASTRGMTPALAQLLEALSSYRIVFPPGQGHADRNPVAFSHLRYDDVGRRCAILSRTCAAGLDYSGRGNTFSHHVILNEAELPSCGPAWAMRQPGFLEKAWDGHVRPIEVGRPPPYGEEEPPRPCRRWQDATGDAGWGGVVAEACLSRQRQLIYLIFEPGMDLLPLIAESLALVPADRRWGVSFSTYYTGTPYGLECQIRGVLNGSQEHAKARRETSALLLDLTVRVTAADRGVWAEAGRTGQPPGLAEVPSPRWERSHLTPVPAAVPEPADVWKKAVAEARQPVPTPARPLPAPPLDSLPPPIAARTPALPPRSGGNVFLPWCIGLFLGMALGAVGMFFGLQLKEASAKSPDSSRADVKKNEPAKTEPEALPPWLPGSNSTWLVFLLSEFLTGLEKQKIALEAEKTKLTSERDKAIGKANLLTWQNAALALEKAKLKRALEEQRTTAHGLTQKLKDEQGHVRRRTTTPLDPPLEPSEGEKSNPKVVYYDFKEFDPRKEYRFALPEGVKLRKKGTSGQAFFWRRGVFVAGFAVPRPRAPADPLIGLWTCEEPPDKNGSCILAFQALGPDEWTLEEKTLMAGAVRSWIHLTEGKKDLVAFRPFQPLPSLRVSGKEMNPTPVKLEHLHDWEMNRLRIKVSAPKLPADSALRCGPLGSADHLTHSCKLFDNSNREYATVFVQLAVAEEGRHLQLKTWIELNKNYVAQVPIRIAESLLPQLAVEFPEISVVIEAGNTECVLARTQK